VSPAGETGTTTDPPRPDGRWELLRALAALAIDAPPDSDRVAATLDLPAWTAVQHTRAFVLGLPPYASIYLGPDGKLGGEGADRVAGVWRILGLTPPADPDHLGAVLGLYCELGEASCTARRALTRQRLERARATVLWEHLWPWVPLYLEALSAMEPAAQPWASLLARAVGREAALTEPAVQPPLALRHAPGPIVVDGSYPDLLDALVAPVRVGLVLTHADLGVMTGELDVGLRRGERRYVLDAILQQDAAGGLAWLAAHARRSADRHRRRAQWGADPSPWWATRADATATVLDRLAAAVDAGNGSVDAGDGAVDVGDGSADRRGPIAPDGVR
jgi:hypothetical protein